MLYLIESSIGLAVFYAFYHLALRRETFFQLNRWYLLLTPLLAFGIPALHLQMDKPVPKPAITQTATPQPAVEWTQWVESAQKAPNLVKRTLDTPVPGWKLNAGTLLWWIYLAVVSLMLARLLLNIRQLLRFLRKCKWRKLNGVRIAELTDNTPTASFFGFIFQGKNGDDALVLEHEMVHVRQWHSLDLIFMELLLALQWFNPLLYFYRSSLRAVHEYIADDCVVRRTRQRYAYAQLLAQYPNQENWAQPGLVNTFHSLLKQRLIMLAKHPSHPMRRSKYLLALPVFTLLMLLFSFRFVDKLPAAAAFSSAVKELDSYARDLSEIVIFADQKGPEPTPYIFYWGQFEAHFQYLPSTQEYFAEVHLSANDLKNSLDREPRLWTGETLLQQIAFQINGMEVRSDYYKPETYKSYRPQIEQAIAQAGSNAVLELSNIHLPNGKTGQIFVFTDLPDGNPTIPAPLSSANKYISIEWIKWGTLTMSPAQTHYITADAFETMLQSPLEVQLKDAKIIHPDALNFSISDENGVVVRPRASMTDALSADELRKQFAEKSDKIKAGNSIWVEFWEPYEAQAGMQYDTIITFDPETFEEKIQIVQSSFSDYDSFRRLMGVELGTFRLVANDDPRRFLKAEEERAFEFSYSMYNTGLAQTYHALAFTNGDHSRVAHADRSFSESNNKYTVPEIIEMLKGKAELSVNGQASKHLSFTVKYKDFQAKAVDGVLPPEAIAYLQKHLKPYESIEIADIKAVASDWRQVVCSEAQLASVNRLVSSAEIQRLDVINDGDGPKLFRFTVKSATADKIQQAAAAAPGLWFQDGDIDFSNLHLRFEARNEDPKPPLPAVRSSRLQASMQMSASPNPSSSTTTVRMSLPEDGQGALKVISLNGQETYRLETYFHEGESRFALPKEAFPQKGVYLISLEMPYGVNSFKLEVL